MDPELMRRLLQIAINGGLTEEPPVYQPRPQVAAGTDEPHLRARLAASPNLARSVASQAVSGAQAQFPAADPQEDSRIKAYTAMILAMSKFRKPDPHSGWGVQGEMPGLVGQTVEGVANTGGAILDVLTGDDQ